MPGLVFEWFPLCEFSLFDTPQGQFSSSLRSWSQCSHSKGSGLELFCFPLCFIRFHLFIGCHLQRSCTLHLRLEFQVQNSSSRTSVQDGGSRECGEMLGVTYLFFTQWFGPQSSPLCCPSPFPFPTGNHQFVLCICVSFHYTQEFVLFVKFHMCYCTVCLSLSDLFHLA